MKSSTPTFLSRDQMHTLKAVLQEMDPSAPKERRRKERHPVTMTLWIRTLARTKNPLYKVFAVDVSPEGVGILAQAKLSMLQRFVMPLRFDDGGGSLVLCQVRNVRELAGGHHKIGAQILETVEDPDGQTRVPPEWLAV